MSRRRRHTSFAERWEGVEKREREKREREAFFFPLSGARFLPLAYSLIEQPDSAGSEETGGSPQFTARGVGWEERERERCERTEEDEDDWMKRRASQGVGEQRAFAHALHWKRDFAFGYICAWTWEVFFLAFRGLCAKIKNVGEIAVWMPLDSERRVPTCGEFHMFEFARKKMLMEGGGRG